MNNKINWRLIISIVMILFMLNGIYQFIITKFLNISSFMLVFVTEIVFLLFIFDFRIKESFLNKNNMRIYGIFFVLLLIIGLFCQINLAYILQLAGFEINKNLISIISSFFNLILLSIFFLLLPKTKDLFS